MAKIVMGTTLRIGAMAPLLLVLTVGCRGQQDTAASGRTSAGAEGALAAPGAERSGAGAQLAGATVADAELIRVYKTPTCGCCSGWVDHLREHGYEVATQDMEDLTPVKVAQGVPARLQTCHTATVGGYVIEGHVPADVIQRLLEERPDLVGLAVPGMPTGSPGMEVPGRSADPYEVIGFRRDGSTVVYARR